MGQSLSPSFTPLAPNLSDWYPRNAVVAEVQSSVSPQVSLVNSGANTLTIAVNMAHLPDGEDSHNGISAILLQLDKLQAVDIAFIEYVFNLTSDNSTISGRDSVGRNMKFDAAAIEDGRVTVRVNGVVRNPGTGVYDFVASPNLITFNTPLSAGSKITVEVFSVAQISGATVELFRHDTANSNQKISGAWNNIKWILVPVANSPVLAYEKWWLFSSISLIGIDRNSQYRISGLKDTSNSSVLNTENSNAAFLLSDSPNSNFDRVFHSLVTIDNLMATNSHLLKTDVTTTAFNVDSSLVKSINPAMTVSPLGANDSSYLYANIASKTGAKDAADVLSSATVIGPL